MLTVKLEPGSRPARLRAEVDARYFRFVATLPAAVREAAGEQRTFSGRPGAGRFAGPSGLNPVVAGAPWLFWERAAALPDERLLAIAEAGGLLGAAYVILDHLTDGQLPEPEPAALLQQACFARAQRLLTEEFAPEAVFRERFERLWGELLAGLVAERAWQSAPGVIGEAAFRQAASAKAAPVAVTLAALIEAGGRDRDGSLFAAGEASLKAFGAAAQLAHDVGDWRGDVRDNHWTYFLSRAAALSAGDERPPEAGVQAAIDEDWLDVTCLQTALAWLGEAGSRAVGMGCAGWSGFLAEAERIMDDHLQRCLAGHVIRVGTATPAA